MKYQKYSPIDRKDAEAIFRGADVNAICTALVRVAFHEPDYRWAQKWCLDFCGNSNADIKGVAITCIGHIARVHGKIDLNQVTPVFQKLSNDPSFVGRVEDAWDDINTFIK